MTLLYTNAILRKKQKDVLCCVCCEEYVFGSGGDAPEEDIVVALA